MTYTQEQASRLHDLLGEAMLEYVDHASWRCEHRPHFYLAAGPPDDGKCPCGLDDFMERVRVVLLPVAAASDEQREGPDA